MKVAIIGSWALAAALLLMVCAPAAAGDEEAAKKYRDGVKAFEQADYETALAQFTEAYNLSGKPDLLYNLAVCSEKTGDMEKAKAYYELYLEENPDAEDAENVRKRLAALEAGPDATTPEPTEEAPSEQEPGPPTPPVETAPEEETAPVEEEPFVPYEDENDEREVFWPGVVMGAGALVMASGGLTAIAAYKKYGDLEDSCAPDCSDEKVDETRAVAIAADVQLAVGGAAVAAGLIWWLAKRKKDDAEGPAARALPVPVATTNGGGIALSGRF